LRNVLVSILSLVLMANAWAKTPPKPTGVEFIKAATWQETLIANREALWQWENQQDAQDLEQSGISLGAWQVLGPLSAKSKDIQVILSGKSIDLAHRWIGAAGQELAWESCAQLKDGQVNDLTGCHGAAKDAVFLVYRTIKLPDPAPKHKIYFDLATDGGNAVWLPEHNGPGVRSRLPLLTSGAELQLGGAHQFVMHLTPNAAGQCRFFFAIRAADRLAQRTARRQQICRQVRDLFPNPLDQMQFQWETQSDVWHDPGTRVLHEWLPGHADEFLQGRYQDAIASCSNSLQQLLAAPDGIKSQVVAPLKDRLQALVDTARKTPGPKGTTAQLRAGFYQLCTARETIDLAARVRSLRLAVEDQRAMFKDRYPQGDAALQRVSEFDDKITALCNAVLAGGGVQDMAALKEQLATAQSEILLHTPVLAFDKLLIAKGNPGFNSNWGGPNHIGSELVTLSPVAPDGKQTTIYKGTVSDMDLNWDGQRILFSDGNALSEIKADGTGLHRVSATDPPVSHYDGCYLPNGQILSVSAACEQAVPCTGGGGVGNIHLMDADGKNERRITYDQDHDWNPSILNDGRVLYTRWEYTDLPHYFSRILFRMNPDGAGQVEYYGSGSYWPNGVYWPRAIPGHPTAIVGIVSGHHGVSRSGELLIFDPAKGRHESSGVVQRIPGYQQKVEPVIQDQLVTNVWPKFAAPYPLAEPGTNLGAGKYFLVCVQQDALATWDLYLVDIFDNMTPLLKGGYMTPIPLRPRPVPPVIPSNLNPQQSDAVVSLNDIYRGNGLKGYPRGSIKALRVGTHQYRYAGNGDTMASSYQGGWDVKRILGTVPVYEDGSAMFRVPANTPIFVQPLDAEGKSQQQMRSWYSAMPGEIASCVGCHESQNSSTPSPAAIALSRQPVDITPWDGPTRGFSFEREVQPVLERRCVGCHDGQPYHDGAKTIATEDLRAKSLHPEWKDHYSPAYMVLQKYVRRAGYEADMHLLHPAEFDADTSVLVQMLKKGHYNVTLTPDEWQHLYAWIDFNIPYPANWRESHRPPTDAQVALRAKYKKIFANIDDHHEDPLPLPPSEKFVAPTPLATPTPENLKLENWPLAAAQAKTLQTAAGPATMELDLGEHVKMKCALIPAGRFIMGTNSGFADEGPTAIVGIDRPFYMGQLTVTNRQYALFDPTHENGYVEGRGKDRTTRGVSMEQSEYPVVHVSWNEALAYCQWLSSKTGVHCTLPTEAQWEWACRAGTASTYNFGEYTRGQNNLANIADTSIASWNYGRCENGYSDGAQYLAAGGRYAPNAWGLYDMHGNAAEWCLSVYKPYPYKADDGRDDPRTEGMKVVRGGSWNDTMRYVTSASRWRYPAYQPVYNVGFRVVVDFSGKESKVAAR